MLILETSRKINARKTLYGKRKSVKQFVIMTPENPMKVCSTSKSNSDARKEFERILQYSGVYAYPVEGNYGGNSENSYIVFNIPLLTAKSWANAFDQEIFIFATVIDENKVKYDFWSKKKSKNDQTATAADKEYVFRGSGEGVIRDDGFEEDYTLVGNGFKFTIPFKFFECVSFYDDLIDERCQRSKLYEAEWESLLARSLQEYGSGWGRIIARAELYGKLYEQRFESPEAKEIEALMKG